MLSDEPCWGQLESRPRGMDRRHVSVLSDEPCWGQSDHAVRYSEYYGVSVLSDEPCWGQSSLAKGRLSDTNLFQCSPTSRVGVNVDKSAGKRENVNVSVLSDEPCWGQLWSSGAVSTVLFQCFSALRRAVLGSIVPANDRPCRAIRFQCSPTSRVGVNH